MPQKKRKQKVRYHGLDHPHVLHHVWVHHDWFENCVPRADDDDHSEPEPDSDDTTGSPADNPAII